MRIAVWNVERLKHKKYLDKMLYECEKASADILVLTETDERINPNYKYCFNTSCLKGISVPAMYGNTENRVSIFTNYKCVNIFETYDKSSVICIELETERGNLLVYGTIIGITGNRNLSYKDDLQKQLSEIKCFADSGYNICVIGDYNCSFCDNYYFTNFGRNTMLSVFDESRISILTRNIGQCIDHIAISENFINNAEIHIDEWNLDKTMSDHKGVVAEI